MLDAEARRAGSKLAIETRYGRATEELRDAYRTAAWRSRVKEIVDQAPPLTDEQRAEIRRIVQPIVRIPLEADQAAA